MWSKKTAGWILLGSCLARQGKLREVEEIHRQASLLEGDPDEAFLNLGLVLRAQGQLEEAAAAVQRALELEPQYEVAPHTLEDILAALALQEEPLEKGGPHQGDVEGSQAGRSCANAEDSATVNDGE